MAKDVCGGLGLANISMALSSLDDDEKMTIINPDSHSGKRGGAQFITVVNEWGFYSLVGKSRKPQAKVFKRWVNHDANNNYSLSGKRKVYIKPITWQ